MSKNRKEKEYLDPATNRVVADYTQNEPTDFMDRIHQVNRLCPGQSKQNINYLLKMNDYDVDLTVRRINEEGAKELIGEWSKSTSKKSKKKKNAQKEQTIAPTSKPQNYLDIRPASDSKTTKLSNSTTHKPTTAPPVSYNPQTAPRINSFNSPPSDPHSNSHLQPAHHFNPDNLQFHQSVVSQRHSPNLSTGGSSNIQFLLLQLQTQSSQLTQWQDMLQQRMDNSLQLLQFVFEQLQTSLNERYQLLYSNIESGKGGAKKIFEQRRKLAQKLIAQAKKAPTEQTAENIRNFLADKICDQQLNDVYTLEIEHEALLSGLQSLGDVVNSIPVYSNWTPQEGTESVPSYAPPPQTQQIQQPPPSKYPPKHPQPVYTVPDTTLPPVNNYAPTRQAPETLTNTEELVPPDEFLEPTPEVSSMTSRVMVVTLKDPYSSEAKAVDLKSLASKTTKEELEAAKLRMQQVLDKQGRSMIVSDAGGRGPVGPAGNRGGERRGGKSNTGNRARGGGRYNEKRGPPARYQDQAAGGQNDWSGSGDNGPVWSAEFTPTNNEEPDESWDSTQYVESIELVNNNYSDGENDTLGYNPIVPSTEFNSSQQDFSTEPSDTPYLPHQTQQPAPEPVRDTTKQQAIPPTSTTDSEDPSESQTTNWASDADW